MNSYKALSFHKVKFQGSFFIKADYSLEETAKQINQALNINLQEDFSGYYEEIPAFDCIVLGIHFALLGIPDPEHRMPNDSLECYNFQISDNNNFDVQINIGTNIIDLLNSNTSLVCKEEWNENHYINSCINVYPIK